MLMISDVIKEKRSEADVTQSQLAEFCNVTKASVSKWEQKLTYPDITLLPKIAAFFNITVDELLRYETILTKEQIRTHYFSFAKRFTDETFTDVFTDINIYVKKYYNDENVLLQMSILLFNHYMLSDAPQVILSEAKKYLERLEDISSDVWILKQANSLLSMYSLFSNKPEDALKRLTGAILPSVGDELLLAETYIKTEQLKEATKTIQVMVYQHILEIIGSTSTYLQLVASNAHLLNEAIHRSESLIDLYEVDVLHPNLSLQFYLSVATIYAQTDQTNLLFEYLNKYVTVCEKYLFPIHLKGDDYFTLIDDWINELDLGSAPPRDDAIIKESMLSVLSLSDFLLHQTDDRMTELHKRLERI